MKKLISFLISAKIVMAIALVGGTYLASYAFSQPAGSSNNQVPATDSVAQTGAESPDSNNAASEAEVASDSSSEQNGEQSLSSEVVTDEVATSEGDNVEQAATETSEADSENADDSQPAQESRSAAEIYDGFLPNLDSYSQTELESALFESIRNEPELYAEFVVAAIDRGLELFRVEEVIPRALQAAGNSSSEVLLVSTEGINANAADPGANVSSLAANTGNSQGVTASIRPSIPTTAPIASASPAR